MSLRIAHVTATFPPYRGGTGNVCFHNARELARRGHEVHVFTAAMPGAAAREARDGITIHRLRPLLRIGNAPVLPGLLTALRGFDVIHLHYPFIVGAEIVRLASLWYRIPLIVSFHNDLIGDGVRAHIFNLYQRLSARMTVYRASRLCVVSLDHYESSKLRSALAGSAVAVVELPNGVDACHFSPAGPTSDIRFRHGIPLHAKVVLFVAALDRAHHFKGLSILLQALQTLPADVRLLVLGDGDLRQTYERQATLLGLAERVIFAGGIDHKETPPFFRSADLTVLPSSPPESFGLVLIESLACGTPVVASDIPGVRTVVNHGVDGLLVQPNNPTALAQALQCMLEDTPRSTVMGRLGREKVVARYDWGQIGTRLETIYRQVLHESGAYMSAHARGKR